jgi:putative colanic acid biosynthesis acetyltransferase WcaF
LTHTIVNVDVPTRDLAGFTGAGYDVGRGRLIQGLWLLVSGTVFMRWWIPAKARVAILRAFGAQIGDGVLIRHRVRIHWPWKLIIGDRSWIGEGAWILNLEPVYIGSDTVVSQDAMLCTGSHARKTRTFEFDNAPIWIDDGVWIAVRATVLRGVRIESGATVGANVVISRDVGQNETVFPTRLKRG